MALAPKIVNWEGGSDARYNISGLQRLSDGSYTDGTYQYDSDGRDLSGRSANDRSWTPGLPGARGGTGPGSPSGGGGRSYAIPGAGEYGQAVTMAKARYQQRLADLNKSRQGLFRQSGFKGDVNAETGLVSNLGVDPYNQYGSFQLLNRAQAIRDQQGVDMNIGRGLGTGGGLAAQNMNDLRFGYGQEDAAFGSALTDQLGAFTRQQQDYKYEYDQALYEAQLEAARMAIENGDFYPGGDGGGGDDSSDDGSQTSFAKEARAVAGRTVPRKPALKATPGNYRNVKKKPANTKQNPYAFRPVRGGGSR